MNTAKENELYLSISCLQKNTVLCQFSWPRYPTAKLKNYQQNVTVGGAFNSIRESIRHGPEMTNWCIFYELPRE